MIIDCHVHCGMLDDSDPQRYEDIASEFDLAGVDAAVCFSPVAEIYDRYSQSADEDESWQERRDQSRRYLLSLRNRRHRIFPFYFVWNDFNTADLDSYCGIKWHRHWDEPEYRYDDPKCAEMLAAIRERGFAILLEETYENMIRLVDRMGQGIPFVIPHLGLLNGGIRRLLDEDFWRRENTYADMSAHCASIAELREFVSRYGAHRLLYGSDYPFSTPAACKEQVLALGLSSADEELVFHGNISRLLRNTGSQT